MSALKPDQGILLHSPRNSHRSLFFFPIERWTSTSKKDRKLCLRMPSVLKVVHFKKTFCW